MNTIPEHLQRLLTEHGVEIAGQREIEHATQYHLIRGPEEATLNVYRTGKISEGGESPRLRELLRGWRVAHSSSKTSKESKSTRPALDATPRIGIDEAGKGDYFGPLVVAGVRVSGEKVAQRLQEIGVRDSKDLSVAQALRLARDILENVRPENTCLIVLSPVEYEKRRKAAGNINRLLGELDTEIIYNLKGKVEKIVVDEFARSAHSYLEPFVPRGIYLEVRKRAEDDAAVAAASILARARQLEEMESLSEQVGFELPRGAANVLEAARRVLEERGEEGLAGVAKISFATTGQVLGN